jgi:hypothetical protein
MALTPSSLEVSLHVAADLQKQREEAEAQWQKRLERAEYEAERARRQYDAVEPENRLVARTLEGAWEEKLRIHRDLVEQYERFLQDQPRLLNPNEQAQIRRLAADLPTLWNASNTTDADRKEILRQVVDKVVVNVEGNTEWVEATVHWMGGYQTYTRLRRPVARLEQLSTWPELRARVEELKAQGCKVPAIVERLNDEGFRAPNGKPFTHTGVRTLLCRYGLTQVRRRLEDRQVRLGQDEWLIPDLAKHLDVPYGTIHGWIKRGQLSARQIDGPQGRWIVRASAHKLNELTAYKRKRRKHTTQHEQTRCQAKV